MIYDKDIRVHIYIYIYMYIHFELWNLNASRIHCFVDFTRKEFNGPEMLAPNRKGGLVMSSSTLQQKAWQTLLSSETSNVNTCNIKCLLDPLELFRILEHDARLDSPPFGGWGRQSASRPSENAELRSVRLVPYMGRGSPENLTTFSVKSTQGAENDFLSPGCREEGRNNVDFHPWPLWQFRFCHQCPGPCPPCASIPGAIYTRQVRNGRVPLIAFWCRLLFFDTFLVM